MTAVARPRRDHLPLATIIADCERRAAEKEAEALRLAEQAREAKADVQQARLLIAYLRRWATES